MDSLEIFFAPHINTEKISIKIQWNIHNIHCLLWFVNGDVEEFCEPPHEIGDIEVQNITSDGGVVELSENQIGSISKKVQYHIRKEIPLSDKKYPKEKFAQAEI